MNQLPRFSVVICNYNYAQFVGEAIQSALSQNYPADKFEVIVVDDGSTDDSRIVYQQFGDDPRFKVVLQENRGQSAAFDAGVRAATGDYVCLLDSDDRYVPDKLARLAAHIDHLDEHPDRLFLCHDLALEHADGNTVRLLDQSWFDVVAIGRLPDRLTLDQAPPEFVFSIPCGLVFSRALAAECLDAMPTWEYPRGADGVLCPAAFIRAGQVHYLRASLGVYRLHGANEFADVVDGRFRPRFNPSVREPKTLRFLEHWLDLQDKTPADRVAALQYLRRREHASRRLSASLRLTEPAVRVTVLGAAHAPAVVASINNSLQSHAGTQVMASDAHDVSELMQLAAAWSHSTAQYHVFVRPGDRLDRSFVERHLLLRQHGALVTASCSDIRLVSAEGSLVHADVFANSGAWKQANQQVPPLATTLRDWVAPPMSGCMFRRNLLLDRLFAHAPSAPPALQSAGFWLLMQFAHHTGGLLRMRETLSSCRLRDGAAASYGTLSAASSADGTLVRPPLAEAVQWFGNFYQQEQDLLRQWLPEAWHRRFGDWLTAQQASADSAAGR